MSKIKAQIPNLLTAGNLIGGVLAIIFALTGRLEWAPYCIFISAILDFFDGFVARLLKVQTELGKQLDSLADMVTFGVAPGVIVYMLIKMSLLKAWFFEKLPFFEGQPAEYRLAFFQDAVLFFASHPESTVPGYNEESAPHFWIAYLALIIPVMSLFRLAKFNLDPRQSDSFIGLPTPANTLFFAAIALIFCKALGGGSTSPDDDLMTYIANPWFLVIAAFVMSIMLVVELPLFALKFKSFKWKGNEIRYIFLTLAVALLATLHWLAIPILIILYILLSIVQNILLKKNEKVQSRN